MTGAQRALVALLTPILLVGCGERDGVDLAGADVERAPAYAGSESCAGCHAEASAAWAGSHHAHAERALDRAQDAPALLVHEALRDCVSNRGELEPCDWPVAGADGETHSRPLRRAFGHDPLWQYLVEGEGGRLQVTQAAWDPHADEWFDVYGGAPREPGDWGHWTGRGMTWNSMCARCHNTGLRLGYDAEGDHFETQVAEMGVGCEACHGPAAEHVARRRAGGEDPPNALAALRAVSGARGFDVCATCHSRRAELTEDFRPGDAYLDHFLPRIPDESGLYHPDGQVREEVFVAISFLTSRMHAEEGVRCGDCHEPHGGTLRREGDALCLDCHAQREGFSEHGHHPPQSEGARCVNCHMPVTRYMQRDPRRDHGFLIPDPVLGAELGIPDACSRCHTDRDREWTIQHYEAWYGQGPADRRHLARTVAGARRGDPSKAAALVEIAREATRPLWRSIALGLLPQLPTREAAAALAKAIEDDDAWIRLSGARALSQIHGLGSEDAAAMLVPLLRDPVRAVRVEAARGLRARFDPDAPGVADLRAHIGLRLDQPGARAELGTWYLARGEDLRALPHLERAADWDPRASPLHQTLAIAQARLGRDEDALATLERASRVMRDDPLLLFDLALAYAGAGRSWEARELLDRIVTAEPEFTRAWYNLGLARITPVPRRPCAAPPRWIRAAQRRPTRSRSSSTGRSGATRP